MKFLSAFPVNTFYAYFDLKNANVFIMDGYKGPDVAADTFLVNETGTSEAQTFTLSGTIASGAATFSFRGITASIPFGTTWTAALLQTTLESISTIGTGNIAVSGTTATGPFTATFQGALANEPQPLIVVVTNTLMTSGPAAITIVITHGVPGVYSYPIGTTTMLLDTGVGIWNIGDTFKVSPLDPNTPTDDNVYTVSAHSETAGSTTSVTFAPGLSQGLQDDSPLIIQPHSINVKLGDGNFTYTEKLPREYKKNRGFLDAVRNADQDPLEVKLEFAWIFIKSASGEVPTIEDTLKQTGVASNWITAGHDPCEPYCVTVRLYYVPPCPGIDNEIIDLAEFRYEELQHDAKTGQIACTAKCNLLYPTVTRVPKDAFNQTITH